MGLSDLYVGGQLSSFLIGLHKHVDHAGQQRQGEYKADNIGVAGYGIAKLVYHKGDGIGEAALITDGEPGPLGAVHLALDSADSREAGGAQEVKDEERIGGQTRKRLGKGCINIALCTVEDAHGADDVLLCDKAGYRGDGSLPVAPAERDEYPGDSRADLCEQRFVKLILREHSEVSVDEAEGER